MKKCEKESLYSLFKVALECIEGFRSSDAMPNFSDDIQLNSEMNINRVQDIDNGAETIEIPAGASLKNQKLYASFEELKKDVFV